jgi:hypothetical protein
MSHVILWGKFGQIVCNRNQDCFFYFLGNRKSSEENIRNNPKCLIWSQIQLFTVKSWLSCTWDDMSELALYRKFTFISLKVYCKCSAQRFPKMNSWACSCRLNEIKKVKRVRESWAKLRPIETSPACFLRFPPLAHWENCLRLLFEISSAYFLRILPPDF